MRAGSVTLTAVRPSLAETNSPSLAGVKSKRCRERKLGSEKGANVPGRSAIHHEPSPPAFAGCKATNRAAQTRKETNMGHEDRALLTVHRGA